MQKIAITGHTKGLGAAVFQRFSTPFFITKGYSRSNGYNISTDLDKILEDAKDCDVLINNAYDRENGWAQIDVLHKFHAAWHSQPKIIINISSVVADRHVPYPDKFSEYALHKNALDKAVHQQQMLKSKCKIINVKFGKLENIPGKPSISFNAATDIIYSLIHSPQYISSITVVPDYA